MWLVQGEEKHKLGQTRPQDCCSPIFAKDVGWQGLNPLTDCQAPIACLDSLDRVTPDHIAETRNAIFFRPCFPSKCGTFYTLTSINVVLGVVRMPHAIFRHTTALQQSYLHVRLLDLKKNAPCLSIFYTYFLQRWVGVIYPGDRGCFALTTPNALTDSLDSLTAWQLDVNRHLWSSPRTRAACEVGPRFSIIFSDNVGCR